MTSIKKKLILLLIIGVLFNSNIAHAYIDPLTTGTVFGALAGVIPAIIAFFAFLFLPLKRLIKYLVKKIKNKKNTETTNQEKSKLTD